MLGQRSGGRVPRNVICVHDCSNSSDAASPDDDLKGFNRAIALQGTPEQSAALASLVEDLQLAKTQLHTILELPQLNSAPPKTSGPINPLDQTIAKLRTQTQDFLASFSAAQKSGLKDLTKKVEEGDSELGKRLAALEEAVKSPKTAHEELAGCTASLDKTLVNFEEEQFALAREMGIILPSTELTFNLRPVANSMNVGGTVISIPASGAVSQSSSVNGHNVFTIKLVADLSDLQDNITKILRSQLTESPFCGERIEIQEVMLIPEAPASHLFTRIHLERWICPPGGQWGPTEAAAGEGALELKLMPLVEKNGRLGVDSEISHVDGNDFVRQSLLGDVGDMLREKITASLVSILGKGADLKLLLPPAAGQSAMMGKAQFQQTAGRLSLVLEGQLDFSDEQTKQFASQLKQRLSARETSTP